ncbi:MAG: type I-E CRISPR-associated protein Cse1/CasA [Armatimonadota bacterium]
MTTLTRSVYDLVTEAWIPCVDTGGEHQQLGIRDVFSQAHELREVWDASPLVTAGILRLLLALLHQTMPLADDGAWEDARCRGGFPPEVITAVEHACAGRFDLFDPDHPFYQSGDIPLDPLPKDAKSIGNLVLDAATGTGVRHYAHCGEGDHAFCPACCAKGLSALPAFATSGGQGIKPSVNGVPPVYVFPQGASLFQTLLLNYLLPAYRSKRQDSGLAWQGEGVVGYKEERSTVGFFSSLTWQARRIRLFPTEGQGRCTGCGTTSHLLVRRMAYAQGWARAEGTELWQDPWAAYRFRQNTQTGTLDTLPIRPQEDRDTWRDVSSLFLVDVAGDAHLRKERQATQRPKVIDQLNDLIADSVLPSETPIRFLTVGLRTDMKAKVFEWRADHFDFPPAVLGRTAALPVARALEMADAVARLIGDALCRLHPEADREKPNWGDISKLQRQVITFGRRQYWQKLEIPFRHALMDQRLVAEEQVQQSWLAAWWETIERIARAELEAVLDNYDTNAAALARQHAARRVFYGYMKQLRDREEV